MAIITNQQRRKVLSFADELAKLAAEKAPDSVTRKELFTVVNSIRKRFGYDLEAKQFEVWKALHDGASSIGDLILMTKFHKDDIYEITRTLESAKFVQFKKMSLTGNGRPQVLIFPVVDFDSFSPQKLN